MTNTLFDSLFESRASSKEEFLHLPGGESFSYAAFNTLAARITNVFAKLGLCKGDRVALQVDKSPMALAVYAACVRSGCVLLPLNTAYTSSELTYFMSDATPGLIICDSRVSSELQSIADSVGAELLTLDSDGGGSLAVEVSQQIVEHSSEELALHSLRHGVVDCGPDDLAAILYTSGTTGRSKGAMLTHQNLMSNAKALAELWQFTENDVLLHALPIFHTHGLFVAVNTCAHAGASMIFQSAFKVDTIIDALPHATVLMGVPTFYTRLLGAPAFTKDLVSSIRLFVSGSAPLLAETHIAFEDRTGHRILERYGMTETNMNASNPYLGERRAGTVGHPLPGVDIRITEPATGEPVAQGETGIIEVRGPNVFKGYWNMPEKTAEELRANGFFITGDLGMFDQDGYLHIVGRQKDLIISGGYNIYPKEIEVQLDEIPSIVESAVIGVHNADFGESVVAYVVTEGGIDVQYEQILEQIKPHLARFKLPREIIVVDELPRNTMGKVQKNILRERYTAAAPA